MRIKNPTMFKPSSEQIFSAYKCYLEYKSNSEYYPQVRLLYSYNQQFAEYQTHMFVTLSVPKILFGNNLHELEDADFDAVVRVLRITLNSVGIVVSDYDIMMASVVSIDYGKNIITTAYEKAINIIDKLQNSDIKRLRIRHRDHNKGGATLSFASSTSEIVLYDKVREMKSSIKKLDDKGTLKRCHEEALDEVKNEEVLRLEVRLKNKRKIREICKKLKLLNESELTNLTFQKLFNVDFARKICNYYYKNIVDATPTTKENGLNSILQAIFENPDFQTGKRYSNMGAVWSVLMLGSKRVREDSPKKAREAQKLLAEIKEQLDEKCDAIKFLTSDVDCFTPILHKTGKQRKLEASNVPFDYNIESDIQQRLELNFEHQRSAARTKLEFDKNCEQNIIRDELYERGKKTSPPIPPPQEFIELDDDDAPPLKEAEVYEC